MFFGIYGYFVEAKVRIGFSVPQVRLGAVRDDRGDRDRRADVPERRGAWARSHWGKIHPISQYVLIFLAVTFTWLMGLMGYVRSGLRQHWHVYGVMRDTSVDAFTPTLGFATRVVSVDVLLFFLLIGFVFWLASLSDHKKERGA